MTILLCILFVAFIVLQCLDVHSTNEALKLMNVVEANPVARWFMDKLGILPALLITKILVITLVSTACLYSYKENAEWKMVLVLLVLQVLYTVAVVKNYSWR